MNDQKWIREIIWTSGGDTLGTLGVEEVYTLYMNDFREMPYIDYLELSKFDVHIQALLN